MKRGKLVFLAAAVTGALWMNGCSKQNDVQTAAASVQTEETEIQKETETEKRAEKTDSAEEEEEKKSGNQAILVVSFGTSYNDSRKATIGAIEQTITQKFPDFSIYRAFTSQIIIDKLKERDGLVIDNVEEALNRLAEDGIENLVVQPTHLMDGFEYMDLAKALDEYRDKFSQVVLAEPLLTDDEDYEAVIQAITDSTSSYDDGETAVCFMGHGTEADSNRIYPKLQEKISEAGFSHYYIGTVEAEPTLEDVIAKLKENPAYKKVVLHPLMVVAGDHANNDMAGDEEDSWKSILEAEGYEVECILQGLGQLPAIQEIYAQHTQTAVDTLSKD